LRNSGRSRDRLASLTVALFPSHFPVTPA